MSTAETADQLAERLFHGTLATLELYSIYLGTELGLYDVLDRHGPLAADQLSVHAGIAPRYASEWLEQQAVAGLLTVEADGDAPRQYRLESELARVLLHEDDPLHVAPFASLLAGIGGVLAQVVVAYRTGHGVPYELYGPAFRQGQGNINRPAFTQDLPTAWLGAMPDIVARLESSSRPRIADLGCGQGWSTRALATAYPRAWVDGFDTDAGSIADAQQYARASGLDGRVRFIHGDATQVAVEGGYDLIVVLEVLHDLAKPVEALRAARAALVPGGAVLIADERVAENFSAPGDEVERMMYGWSVTHCLPTQLVEPDSAATGTVLRAGKLREFAEAAGFGRTTELPVHNDFFRLYRLDR